MKRHIPTSSWSRVLIWGAGLFAAAPLALAQHPIPEAERWATITHPGNAPYEYEQFGLPGTQYVGQVNYEYQISRTEVTGSEWFEFVQAYAPFVSPEYAQQLEFTSDSIVRVQTSPGVYAYQLSDYGRDRAIRMGWRFAARYVNWLHNNKATTADAFESGVYETNTFGGSGSTGYTDQIERSPDARYWIPDRDEWSKAAFFDPDRYGLGQPGYWQYPHGSDAPPISGMPDVGETSAGMDWIGMPVPLVAAYREVQSPWGLWDCSGGQREWTGDAILDIKTAQQFGRFTLGSDASLVLPSDWDVIATEFGAASPTTRRGLRIARTVPAPPWGVLIPFLLPLIRARRR